VIESKQRIAVVRATGRVGRHIANVLETEGHDVVAISRSNGVDASPATAWQAPSRA
jgi:putative NADH-flavin reductase